MVNLNSSSNVNQDIKNKTLLKSVMNYFIRYRLLHLMVLPGLLYILLFKYVPMYGLIISFKNYNGEAGGISTILNSPWIGLEHFKTFLNSMYFGRILGNTLIISCLRIIFVFPAAIILALLMNEIRNLYFKKTVQTITYMPYFLSWVVVAGLLKILLSQDNGPINLLLGYLNIEPISFLGNTKYFRGVLIVSEIWKNVGYNTIVYLAAIASVDIEQFEAARVDGATKFQQILHITLPAISEIVAIMLILSIGRILDDNFEQIFNLYSPSVYQVADVFETYIYRTGIIDGKFSYTAAVGMFKSVIAFILILVANKTAKKLNSEGLF